LSRGKLLITNLTITKECFNSLSAYHSDPDSLLNWNLIFTLPAWLKVWWQNFGCGADLYLRAVKRGSEIAGIAPLQIRNGTASIIGSVNLCDYQDFIICPGMETDFFNALLDDLQEKGIERLHLETIRPDSTIVGYLMPIARERQYSIDYRQVDVSSYIDLPRSFDEYLGSLDGKQRHEVRRKIRNLERIGEFSYRVIETKHAMPETVDTFLKLFPEYRTDKAEFMTSQMQTFFRSLAEAMSDSGIIKFGVLEESRRKPVAIVMYFDYANNIYLYNSAYDQDYRSKSVGIISKAKCIQNCIEHRKRKLDFLKGAEQYKYYLGGKELPLYSCEITLRRG
jgi:CelD/BcsL family acetyltransferase involved in cellulose biosynthesis